MKRLIVMSFMFLTGIFLADQYALGQASTKSNRHFGINRKGEVKDEYGTRLDYISKEDIIYNNLGDKLGFVENGKVYDALGNPIGKAKKNGKYYNNQGINILSVKGKNDTCKDLDLKGHKSGTLHRNYKLHNCSVHCIFLQKENDDEKKEPLVLINGNKK